MSFLLKDRSIDLFFSERSIKQWFYGIYSHLMKINESYKIISCTNFILTKSKMKINSILNNFDENKLDENNDYRIKFQMRNNNKENNTFVKSLLLYNKKYKL